MWNKILYGLLFVFWVWVISGWIYGYSAASPEDVSKVVAMAENSEDAKVMSSKFFKEHPAPTNNELKELKGLIDEIAVRDLARKQTGDNAIKTKSETEAVQRKATEAELNKPLLSVAGHSYSLNDLVNYGLFGAIVIIVFWTIPTVVFRRV